MKKRLLLKGLLALSFIFTLVGCTKKKETSKLTGKEIMEKLEHNDFKITYKFYQNNYDKNGYCYDYKGNKTECVREMEKDRSPYISLKHQKSDGEFSFFFKDDGISSISYSEYILLSEDPYIVYRFNADQSYQEVTYKPTLSSSDSCSYLIKGESESNYESCTKSKEDDIKVLISSMEALLKETDLVTSDLSTFASYYYDTYMKTHKKEIDKEIKNTSLTDNQVSEVLSKAGYSIKVIPTTTDYTVVKINDKRNTFELFVKEGAVEIVTYKADFYKDIMFSYYPKLNGTAGRNTDYSCSYNLIVNGKAKEEVSEGYSCTEQEIDDIGMVSWNYYDTLINLGLKEQELFNFAVNYLNTN